MNGVEFFFDKDGEPKAVLIDLRTHGELWEDFRDLMEIAARRHEPTVPLEEVEAAMRRKRKANGNK